MTFDCLCPRLVLHQQGEENIMLGLTLKYVFITALTTGTFLSFHENYWTYAIYPVAIVWGMIALGLTLERLERNKAN